MEKKVELKDYQKWCEENGKDALSTEALEEFKKLKDVDEKEVAEKELVKKAQKCWDAICEYVGKKVPFLEEVIEPFTKQMNALFRTMHECYIVKSAMVAAQKASEEGE